MAQKMRMNYEIKEIIGVASKQEDLHSDWCKAVLKTLLTNLDDNTQEEGIDIRAMNVSNNIMGKKGIRLTIEEAHNMVDILLSAGYGSMEAIEKAYNERMSLLK